MSTDSVNSSQAPLSRAESLNEPIEIDDDGEDKMEEDNDGADPGSKRKLTSAVWNELTVRGVVKAKCMYCFKYLSGATSNGRVLSEHRSRLTPQMVEALMCLQNWFRNKYKGTLPK
jgi:hypothetical protein